MMNRACFSKNTSLHKSHSHEASCIQPLKNNFVRIKNYILLNLFILFCLASCSKRMEFAETSSLTAIKNDVKWVSTSSWSNYSKSQKRFYISASQRDPKYYQEEQLHFSFDRKNISIINSVVSFYSEWYFVVGGDGISDPYVIDSTANNLILINTLDTVTKQISGTFSIKLINKQSSPGAIIQLRDGEFNQIYGEFE